METEARKISLFFFFTTLDEVKALEVATKAIRILRRRIRSLKGTSVDSQIVKITELVWRRNFGSRPRNRGAFQEIENFAIGGNTDLRPWVEFQRLATEPELLCLAWSHLLQIKDDDIAIGLGLKQGIIQYRVSKALRKLGSFTNVTGLNHSDTSSKWK